MDLATGKADGPHRKKLKSYLGIIVRNKVDVTYLIWEDIQVSRLNVACYSNQSY